MPDDPDPDQLLTQNPYVWFSVPTYRNDNRNRFLHPPDMTPLFLASRLVSLLFGLGTMIVAYLLGFARTLLPMLGPLEVVTLATRLPVMWMTLVLGALVYRWAVDVSSRRAGLLALGLFVLNPDVLALPGTLSLNDVQVTVGLYQPEDGGRLPAVQGMTRLPNDERVVWPK